MKSISRSSRYARLSSQDIQFFRSIDSSLVIEDTDKYFVDWMKKYRSQNPADSVVLAPKSTDQISKVLAYCNQRKLAVVPQGETFFFFFFFFFFFYYYLSI